jgi:hypothetical protein
MQAPFCAVLPLCLKTSAALRRVTPRKADTMFTDQLTRAIAAARTPQLDHLSEELWKAYAAGVLSDDDAQAAAEAIHERKLAGAPKASPPPKERRQRSPDKQASIERRRRLAASGPMPPALAARFTQGELAALRIIGDEVRLHGCCGLHIDAIAARAGTCRTVVKNALREARRLGMATITERRRAGQRSLTNVIHIVSAEWLTWLRKGGGVKKLPTTDNRYQALGSNRTFGAFGYHRKEGKRLGDDGVGGRAGARTAEEGSS